MNEHEVKSSVTLENTKTEKNEQSKKKCKGSLILNTSGLRTVIIKDGYIKMVSPLALEKIVCYTQEKLLKPIVTLLTENIIQETTCKNSNKSCRIVQLNKVKDVVQKYVGYDISMVFQIDKDQVKPRDKLKNEEFLFHQLTFRKCVNMFTSEVALRRASIQWAGKCLDLIQFALEHDIRLLLRTCGEVMAINAGANINKKRLKLTAKEVLMVFEARYCGR